MNNGISKSEVLAVILKLTYNIRYTYIKFVEILNESNIFTGSDFCVHWLC